MADPNQGSGESGDRGRLRSDPPPEDLVRERDIFIQQFFRRGAQLSEELLGDIERLRLTVRDLENENARLRAQLASDEAIRDLLRKVEELEAEKRRLLEVATPARGAGAEFAERFQELEEELGNLGTLHVANQQLHASSSVRRAFKSLRELLAQFLGAAQYVLLWTSDGGLAPVSFEGLTVKEARTIPWEDGPIGQAFRTGQPVAAEDVDTSTGTAERPCAVVPLALAGRTVGVIAILRTLPQKTRFVSADRELFRLLAAQAAPAIVHAHLFAQAGKQAPSAQAFIDPED